MKQEDNDTLVFSPLYPFSEEELNTYNLIQDIAKGLIESNSPENFETAEEFFDGTVDPSSIYLGFMLGCQAMVMSVFEPLCAFSRGPEVSKELHLLH